MGSHVVFLQVLLIALSATPFIDGWGKEGHSMVCKIAQQRLTVDASAAVLDLLPEAAGGELSEVCSWADEVRFRYRWSSPLHYINTPGVCTFQYKRDCHNSKGVDDMCVVGAINNYTSQLESYGDSSVQYVHQPLHVGYEADEGGNTIRVRWYRRMTNLHHVWDVSIIETAMKDFYSNDLNLLTEAIQQNLTDVWSDQITKWETCNKKRVTCADTYASESIRLACNYAYKDVENGMTLDDDYFLSRLPVVQERIAQAAVRLAALLNHIFNASVSERNPTVAEI